jgi:hypothetical protein
MSEEAPLTVSVPEAGRRYFGLCRNASYDAAARGDIPTIRIGRLLRVPVRALERMLDRASEPTTWAPNPATTSMVRANASAPVLARGKTGRTETRNEPDEYAFARC